MENQTGTKSIYRLTWLALMVSVISLCLFVGVIESHNDTGLTLWLILFPLLMFVSAPLHGIVLILALIQLFAGNKRAFRWVYLYLVVAVSGHLVVAASQGAFEGVLNDIAQFNRARKEPAQVKLEHALNLGPSSNINDVRNALASGANPNGGIMDNRLPFLVLAASRSDAPVIKALLDAGADPNRRAAIDYGSSLKVSVKKPLPLDLVAFSENKAVSESVELLLAAGADPSPSIMTLGACWRGDLPLYDMAKTLGASGLLDANDKTCLHHAAAMNRAAFLETLLFDPAYEGENAKEMLTMGNHVGQYPLDVAITKKHFEAALLIVRAGGRANKRWTVERALGTRSNDPSLDELKTFLLRHQPQNQ